MTLEPQVVKTKIDQRLLVLYLVAGQLLVIMLGLAVVPYYGIITVAENPQSAATGRMLLVVGSGLFLIGLLTKRMLFHPKHPATDEAALKSILTHFVAAHFLAFALMETVAILGFALFMIGGGTQSSSILALLGFAGILILWPKRSELRQFT